MAFGLLELGWSAKLKHRVQPNFDYYTANWGSALDFFSQQWNVVSIGVYINHIPSWLWRTCLLVEEDTLHLLGLLTLLLVVQATLPLGQDTLLLLDPATLLLVHRFTLL